MAEKFNFGGAGYLNSFHSDTSSQPDQNGHDVDMDDSGFFVTQAVAGVRDVHRQLRPLQAEADRLGKQVESFAEALDRLGSKIYERPVIDCTAVLPMIKEYEAIAKETVAQLRVIRDPNGKRQKPSEWGGRLRGLLKDEILGITAEDLRWWEQEQQTWNLLSRVVQTKYPAKHNDPTQPRTGIAPRPRKNAEVHRYSTEQTLWQNFLAEDDTAWERHLILEWLRSSADEMSASVEDVIEQSGQASVEGVKVGVKGWEASKGIIKSQKRLKSWPTPLDPNSPGVDRFDLKTSNHAGLITQLDPDAVTRQGRQLESQDATYEHGTWLGCWEMLKRGRSWNQIRAWCKERTDIWRAVLLRGEVHLPIIPGEKPSAGTLNWQSRSLWRQVCVTAAMDGGSDDYERAVYGILSGYLPSVLNVCRSWDEYLFAHYNSYLHYQFEVYLFSNYPERQANLLFKTKSDLETTLLNGTSLLSGRDIMAKMRHTHLSGDMSQEPHKMIQASFIAGQFLKLMNNVGRNLAKSLSNDRSPNVKDEENVLKLMDREFPDISNKDSEDLSFTLTMQDYNMLRLLTHIRLVFQALGCNPKNEPPCASENVVIAFGDFLMRAGKHQLLPLYAAKMSLSGRLRLLALELPTIQDTTEREIMLRLLNYYGIDILEVLDTQLRCLVSRDLEPTANWSQTTKLRILQDVPSIGYGGVRLIKASFLSPSDSRESIDLIHGFEWLNLLEGNWKRTLTTGVVLYKHFLSIGDFSAGRRLAKTIPFSHISIRKTPKILGYEFDLSQHGPYDPSEANGRADELSDVDMPSGDPSVDSKHIGSWLERDILTQSAALFRDLESLFLALDAMENWGQLAAKVNRHGKDIAQSKIWRSQMRTAQSELDDAMNPIWSSEWLQGLEQEKENSAENLAIRDQFLPELLIAYITALNFYGHAVSRDYLIECMELIAYIADDSKGKHIVETLMRTKRMAEFVELVTRVSKEMVGANETLQKGNSKRKVSRKMALWSVRAQAA